MTKKLSKEARNIAGISLNYCVSYWSRSERYNLAKLIQEYLDSKKNPKAKPCKL